MSPAPHPQKLNLGGGRRGRVGEVGGIARRVGARVTPGQGSRPWPFPWTCIRICRRTRQLVNRHTAPLHPAAQAASLGPTHPHAGLSLGAVLAVQRPVAVRGHPVQPGTHSHVLQFEQPPAQRAQRSACVGAWVCGVRGCWVARALGAGAARGCGRGAPGRPPAAASSSPAAPNPEPPCWIRSSPAAISWARSAVTTYPAP
jgi:hypothetical protein